MRVGFGYDVHRLADNRPLVLGGVAVPHTSGLLGHSDADVLVHAVMDALLGAAGLGDIGRHFPPDDPQYKDVSSMKLLDATYGLLKGKGYSVKNVDTTVVCEAPRLAGFAAEMERNISTVLEVEPDTINVKATTEEGLGVTGDGHAIAAYAVALIEKGV